MGFSNNLIIYTYINDKERLTTISKLLIYYGVNNIEQNEQIVTKVLRHHQKENRWLGKIK